MSSNEIVEYRGWTVEVQRKAFRRNVSIILKPEKPIIVRAARLTSLSVILSFLESRRSWIEGHLERFQQEAADLPDQRLMAGQIYPFLGQDRTLKIVPTPTSKVFTSVGGASLLFHLPESQWREKEDLTDLSPYREALRKFYRREGERFLIERTQLWARQTGFQPREVKVREARSRWGSCHPDGKVTLNWRLMVFPLELIDYVIVHELCHLKHMNHSKAFWAEVHRIMPDAKARSRAIRERHRLSDFLEVR